MTAGIERWIRDTPLAPLGCTEHVDNAVAHYKFYIPPSRTHAEAVKSQRRYRRASKSRNAIQKIIERYHDCCVLLLLHYSGGKRGIFSVFLL